MPIARDKGPKEWRSRNDESRRTRACSMRSAYQTRLRSPKSLVPASPTPTPIRRSAAISSNAPAPEPPFQVRGPVGESENRLGWSDSGASVTEKLGCVLDGKADIRRPIFRVVRPVEKARTRGEYRPRRDVESARTGADTEGALEPEAQRD